MAKRLAGRQKAVRGPVSSGSKRRRDGWVRKNVAIDQRKLDIARRELGVRTETEAIDLALDAIAFRKELSRGIEAVRRSGGVVDVFGGPHKG